MNLVTRTTNETINIEHALAGSTRIYPINDRIRSDEKNRFAEVEVVAIMTALISKYTIHLTPEVEAEFEVLDLTVVEREERLLKSKVMITTT